MLSPFLILLQEAIVPISLVSFLGIILTFAVAIIGWFSRDAIMAQRRIIENQSQRINELERENVKRGTEITNLGIELRKTATENAIKAAENNSATKDHVNDVFYKILEEFRQMSVKIEQYNRNIK